MMMAQPWLSCALLTFTCHLSPWGHWIPNSMATMLKVYKCFRRAMDVCVSSFATRLLILFLSIFSCAEFGWCYQSPKMLLLNQKVKHLNCLKGCPLRIYVTLYVGLYLAPHRSLVIPATESYIFKIPLWNLKLINKALASGGWMKKQLLDMTVERFDKRYPLPPSIFYISPSQLVV